MEFFNIIENLLSIVERRVYKLAKIHPINYMPTDFNRHDIETGLYYGENIMEECRLTIHYNPNEECKWAYDDDDF